MAESYELVRGALGRPPWVICWGAIQDIRAKDKLGWILLVGVIAKVIWEQIAGGSASSAELIGARVAVEAHLAGVLGGLFFSAAEQMKKKIAIEN